MRVTGHSEIIDNDYCFIEYSPRSRRRIGGLIRHPVIMGEVKDGENMNPYDYYITPKEYEQAAQNGVSAALLEVRIRTLAWPKQKAINTRPHIKKPLADWVEVAAAHGICYSTLRYRINRLGWEPERAATQPLQDRVEQAKNACESSRKYPKEMKELAAKNGIPERTFHRRCKVGWDLYVAATRPVMTIREIGMMTKEVRGKYLKLFFKPKKCRDIVAEKVEPWMT